MTPRWLRFGMPSASYPGLFALGSQSGSDGTFRSTGAKKCLVERPDGCVSQHRCQNVRVWAERLPIGPDSPSLHCERQCARTPCLQVLDVFTEVQLLEQ
jgi:hypothetical protein